MATAIRPERRISHANAIKTAFRPFAIKSVDPTARTFEGMAAAYTLDLGGDIIEPGAFAKTLAYWSDKGFAIPLINQHSYFNGIHDVLGSMIEAEERPEGLWGKFEVDDGEDGQKLMRHIEKKRLGGLSIGYQVPAGGADVDQNGIRHLKEILLREVSAVIWPMNTDATIDISSIKSLLGDKTLIVTASDDEIKEMMEALDAEAKAREEKANPPISEDEAGKLRDSLLSLRLRSLTLGTSGQKSATHILTGQINEPEGAKGETRRATD